MKCVIKDCINESTNGFMACDSRHGMMFKIIKDTLKRLGSSKERSEKDVLSQWTWYISNDPPSVEDAIYYGKFIR